MRIRYAIVGFVALVMPFFWLHAQTAEEIRNQISVHNAQIETLNKDIAAYEKQLVRINPKKDFFFNKLK